MSCRHELSGMSGATELTTVGEVQTEAAGLRLGRALRTGDLLALDGEVGAGKTALVRGVAAGLGLDPHRVRSPTFALHHVYRRGSRSLHHIDCYRLGPGADLEVLELEGLLEDGVVAMEWAEYADLRAYSPLRLRLEVVAAEQRTLRLDAVAPQRIREALLAATVPS
ncbi:MAG: tRNA (adenosine(37)-N6)-threonylcarbamoyltransferase complex ATPase subunit type 1 TsaE [Candidatus Dormibacteria bacterium]